MEPSENLSKFPYLVIRVSRVVMSAMLILLALVLLTAAMKIIVSLLALIFNGSVKVPYAIAEQVVMFFLYFGFLGQIVQYFRNGYHFPLRYFIYAGVTAMVRLIIVDHESASSTLLFALSILVMVISLFITLYSDKLKHL